MACASVHPSVWAQDYPRKTIKLIIPATTGSSDVIARALAPRLGAALGQSVVVEQMPGAGTNIGNNHVANDRKGIFCQRGGPLCTVFGITPIAFV